MTLVQEAWVCANFKVHPDIIILPAIFATPHPLVNELPTPLALLIADYFQETSPFIKLHRMIDAAEMVVRFFFIATICDLYKQLGDFPATFKDQLVSRLAKPLFSDWGEMLESALGIFGRSGRKCLITELPEVWHKVWKPLIGNNRGNEQKEILPLRNNVAHAGRLTDITASNLLSCHQQRFEGALENLAFLANYRLVSVFGSGRQYLMRGLPDHKWNLPHLEPKIDGLQDNKVYLLSEQIKLSLFPLHVYDIVTQWYEEGSLFQPVEERPAPMLYLRYNKEREILEFTALSPKAHFAQCGKETTSSFLQIFNLHAWSQERQQREVVQKEPSRLDQDIKNMGYDFLDLASQFPGINALVGRKDQLNDVQRWIKNHRQSGGRLWIGGKPGVGKSAFMFALWKRLTCDKKNQVSCLIPFFFRDGDPRCSLNDFYRSAILHLERAFVLNVGFEPRKLFQEQFLQTLELLRQKQRLAASPPIVVFLLDGLDEISADLPGFTRFVLSQSNPGWVLVYAGRSELPVQGESGKLWDDGELPPLTRNDIRSLLEQELERLRFSLYERDEACLDGGFQNPFVNALLERSEGLPLYIHLAIDDLKAGRLNIQDETMLPNGLADYFDRLLQRLKVGDLPQMLTDVLALLSWVYEPLPEATITEILSPMYPVDCQGLLKKALCYGHFVLHKTKTIQGEAEWALYHESFREHMRESHSVINTRQRSIHDLLEWCGKWPEHRNSYALKHYHQHLYDLDKQGLLFNLAREDSFLLAQRKYVPDEPDLLLRTLQSALSSAIGTDNAREIAEFLLRHQQQLTRVITEISPLQALRNGETTRAFALSDLHDPERLVLWYLLLTWELLEKGQVSDARLRLQKLEKKALRRLDSWREKYAVYLLDQIEAFSLVDLSVLRTKFLIDDPQVGPAIQFPKRALRILKKDDNILTKVIKHPDAKIYREYIDSFLESAKQIEDVTLRTNEIIAITTLMIQVGVIEKMRDALILASEAAQEIVEDFDRTEALLRIGMEQIRIGVIADAQNTAQRIDSAFDSSKLFALKWAKQNDLVFRTKKGVTADTIETRRIRKYEENSYTQLLMVIKDAIPETMETVQGIKDENTRAITLLKIATILILAGDQNAARNALAFAFELDTVDQHNQVKHLALEDISIAEAWAGRYKEALEIARKVNKQSQAITSFIASIKQMQEGQVEISQSMMNDARRLTEEIKNPEAKTFTLEKMAGIQLETGDIEGSRVTLAQAMRSAEDITDEGSKSHAFRDIAIDFARAGNFDDALKISKRLEYSELREHVLEEIASVKAQEGNIDDALKVTSRIQDPSIRTRALKEIALIQAKTGQFREALQTTRKFNYWNLSKRMAYKAVILGEIAAAYIIREEMKLGESKLTEAVEIALNIGFEVYRDNTLLDIAIALLHVGAITKAMNIIAKITDPKCKASALCEVALAQVKAGQGEQAVQTMEGILADRNKHLQTVATAMVSEGDIANFKHLILPCAYYPDATYHICHLLADIYPHQADTIAEIVYSF